MRHRVGIMMEEGRKVEEIQKYLDRLEIGIRTDSILYSKAIRKKDKDVRTAEEIRTMVMAHINKWFLPKVLPVKKEQFCVVMERILEDEDIVQYLEPKKSRASRDFHVVNLYNIIYEMAVRLEAFGTKELYLDINKAALIRDAFKGVKTLNVFVSHFISMAYVLNDRKVMLWILRRKQKT